MYSIFHTSFCGSTLLACLLSKSIPTVTEPSWTHKLKVEKDLNTKLDIVNRYHTNGLLVKYPSLTCDIAPHINGKKVFLYQDFKDHLKKLNKDYQDIETKLWTNRFLYLTSSKDVLFINSKELFSNQEDVCIKICNHFNIEYQPVNINFHVKEYGFNMKDYPIWNELFKLKV